MDSFCPGARTTTDFAVARSARENLVIAVRSRGSNELCAAAGVALPVTAGDQCFCTNDGNIGGTSAVMACRTLLLKHHALPRLFDQPPVRHTITVSEHLRMLRAELTFQTTISSRQHRPNSFGRNSGCESGNGTRSHCGVCQAPVTPYAFRQRAICGRIDNC